MRQLLKGWHCKVLHNYSRILPRGNARCVLRSYKHSADVRPHGRTLYLPFGARCVVHVASLLLDGSCLARGPIVEFSLEEDMIKSVIAVALVSAFALAATAQAQQSDQGSSSQGSSSQGGSQ